MYINDKSSNLCYISTNNISFIRIKVERDATRAKSFTTKVTKSTKKFKKTRNSFVLVYLRERPVLRGKMSELFI